jgi:NYN domain
MSMTPTASAFYPAVGYERLGDRGAESARGAGPMRGAAGKVRRVRQTSFRWRPPGRALHVVDIENLAGTAIPTLAMVCEVQVRYLTLLRFGADDQVVLAASHLGLLNAGLGWPHARYRVRSGKDGADLELIDVLEHENVAARFGHVVIGSGDGGFSQVAADLAARGLRITVVSRRSSLSSGLARVAGDVVYLDGNLAVAA